LQDALLHVLPHPSKPLRHTAGTITAALVGSTSMAEWPEMVALTQRYLASSDVNTLDGALNVLYKVGARAPCPALGARRSVHAGRPGRPLQPAAWPPRERQRRAGALPLQ
jgi:hypothetical protein